jgi:hypothetical protein
MADQVHEEAEEAAASQRGMAAATSRSIAAPSRTELESMIAAVVADLMGADVARDAPLAAQGLDSLTAMELRQKLQVPPEQALGSEWLEPPTMALPCPPELPPCATYLRAVDRPCTWTGCYKPDAECLHASGPPYP